MVDLKSEKTQVRKDVRDFLRQVTPEQRAEWSNLLTQRILELPEYQHARTVMVFLSFANEFDTSGIMADAFRTKKKVCAPKVDWSSWRIDPIQMQSIDDQVADEHHINEPAGAVKVFADSIDLVLVPGLAFDIYGHRLGRGGGFYDRFLSRADLRAFRLATTFDNQIRQIIPFDSHDERMDMILSPTRSLRIIR